MNSSPLDNPCPPANGGVHRWLLAQANRCRHNGLTEAQAADDLRSGSSDCGRTVPEREILSAVEKAYSSTWTPRQGSAGPQASRSSWPILDREHRAEILRTYGGLADLWEASPWRIDDSERHTDEIIDLLFPGDPLLCAGYDLWKPATLTRQEWGGRLSGLQFIVPSPMSAPTGLTQGGKVSARSLSNTGSRRFLVVEFDGGESCDKEQWADEHAAILLHLAAYGPLALAVHSGGKSLHGWFYVGGYPENKVQRFMRYSVGLGADPATWNRSQFVRMPDGTRKPSNSGDKLKRQTVFFFNPEVVQ